MLHRWRLPIIPALVSDRRDAWLTPYEGDRRLLGARRRKLTTAQSSVSGEAANDMTIPADKVSLVTGAARGIGAAIALRLAAAGHAVAVNYLGSETEATALVEQIRRKDGRGSRSLPMFRNRLR